MSEDQARTGHKFDKAIVFDEEHKVKQVSYRYSDTKHN